MMLHVTRARVYKGGTLCLNDVSVSLMGGDLTVIAGASGSGKTTLLDVCAGLVALDKGHVCVAGHVQTRLNPVKHGIRRAYLTSEERWQMAVRACDVVAMGCQDTSCARRTRQSRVHQALEAVGAQAWLSRMMPTLTTTQQLRVRLARLLVQMWNVVPDGKAYVFIDAACGSADVPTQQLVFDVARALAKRGAAVALVSHDFTRIRDEADRVILLREGKAAADGRPEDVVTAGRLAIVLNIDAGIETTLETQRQVVLPRTREMPLQLPF